MEPREFVYHLLCSHFSVQTSGIHQDMKLRDLGLDSFDIFFFVAELEKELQCKIPDPDLMTFERLKDVIGYMEKQQGKAGERA
ncbi:acyl carrier protein ['Paenibacillus yunnanensis' Narsing Rao et al. 2020]|uniref:acyl carrier protein n=1 Tax=Paenibacillus tengchongensis TaxID=2608684 RepID=UPI00124DC73B|nr:acyl carrier protein [Paenibacillus tengchongensis]